MGEGTSKSEQNDLDFTSRDSELYYQSSATNKTLGSKIFKSFLFLKLKYN